MPKLPSLRPSSQTWKTFLKNHAQAIVAVDLFTVPTVRFKILYVFLILDLERRRVLHWNVTENPTALWLGQQAVNAFPWDTAPRSLIRDRDGAYGNEFRRRVLGLGIREIVTSRRSPWQNGFVERLIGSVRRECLDHVIVFSDTHLRKILHEYFDYYHRSRTHLGLAKDCPEARPVDPPENGRIVSFPVLGGLHHRYERRAD